MLWGGSFFSLNYPHGDINRGYVIWANYLILTFNLFNLARNSVNWLVVFFLRRLFSRLLWVSVSLLCNNSPSLFFPTPSQAAGAPPSLHRRPNRPQPAPAGAAAERPADDLRPLQADHLRRRVHHHRLREH